MPGAVTAALDVSETLVEPLSLCDTCHMCHEAFPLPYGLRVKAMCNYTF